MRTMHPPRKTRRRRRPAQFKRYIGIGACFLDHGGRDSDPVGTVFRNREMFGA